MSSFGSTSSLISSLKHFHIISGHHSITPANAISSSAGPVEASPTSMVYLSKPVKRQKSMGQEGFQVTRSTPTRVTHYRAQPPPPSSSSSPPPPPPATNDAAKRATIKLWQKLLPGTNAEHPRTKSPPLSSLFARAGSPSLLPRAGSPSPSLLARALSPLNRFLQVTSEDDCQATMADIIMGDDVSPSAVGVSGLAPLAVVASVPVVASGPADWEINGVFLGHSGEEIKSAGPSNYSPPTTYHAVATKWKVAQLFKEAVETGITGGCLVSSLISITKKFSKYNPNFLHRDLLGRIRFNIFLYQSGVVCLEKNGTCQRAECTAD
jgi:hypothetical protein